MAEENQNELKEYDVEINGMKTRMQLNDKDAASYGLGPLAGKKAEEDKAASGSGEQDSAGSSVLGSGEDSKARVGQNKARGGDNK